METRAQQREQGRRVGASSSAEETLKWEGSAKMEGCVIRPKRSQSPRAEGKSSNSCCAPKPRGWTSWAKARPRKGWEPAASKELRIGLRAPSEELEGGRRGDRTGVDALGVRVRCCGRFSSGGTGGGGRDVLRGMAV